MTEIEFHANVPDKLQFSCRLLRKVVRCGTKAVVIADPLMLAQLDRLLWEFSNTEFLPHCMDSALAQTKAVTPILLVEQLDQQAEHPPNRVLINLGQQIPAYFEQFERFIEIASVESGDRLAALARWKHYKDRGYPLKRHDPVSAVANP
jgi:DNA polymerase III subunit chi